MKPESEFYERIAALAECKVEISVKDGATDIHWKGNNAGLAFVAFTVVKILADNTGKTFDESMDILSEMEECFGLEE